MPEARAARSGPEVGRVDGDDRLEAALLVGDEMKLLMRVEIGKAPGRRHVVGRSALLVDEVGRSRGLEPPTPGTTRYRSGVRLEGNGLPMQGPQPGCSPFVVPFSGSSGSV